MSRTVDVVIVGAGIAGLWTFARLRRAGYDVLLLERDAIGCGQTIAAQGILHSGLKYALAGKVNEAARQIMAMPDRWRAALAGDGEVDLSAARLRAGSQLLLMRSGVLAGLKSLVAQRALTRSRDLKRAEWPEALRSSGFDGTVVHLDEPVLDVPSVLRALAEPWRDAVRRIDPPEAGDPVRFLRAHGIEARCLLFTAAAANIRFAAARAEADGVEDQHRPLLQGMLRPAPFPLFAHFVGGAMSDKPVATVTTHATAGGDPVWYLGASVAERPKEADPHEVIAAATRAMAEFLPEVHLSGSRWATLPIDRVEGRTRGLRMPDTPTLHRAGSTLYGWPTKLTFAPMLADMVVAELGRLGIAPSRRETDFSSLPPVGYAEAPWDRAGWTP